MSLKCVYNAMISFVWTASRVWNVVQFAKAKISRILTKIFGIKDASNK